MADKLVKVYPVGHIDPTGRWFGPYLQGVAAIPQSVTAASAAELIGSGAFTDKPPPDEPEPTEAPPDGGVSDS